MDDILVALRAIVALGAVLGLLLFLSRRLQKSQAKGVSPLAGLMPKKLAKLTELVPSRPAAATRPRHHGDLLRARAGIGGKAQLVVAEFGGIRYVLGVTEHGINVVDTQEAPPLAEDVLAEDERPAVSEMPDDIVDRALRSVA